MKFIKFTLSSKKIVTLPFDQAKKILESPLQVVMINEENGEWDGKTINKSFLVGTERDYEEERSYELSRPKPQLPEPVITEAEKKNVEKIKQEIAESFSI